MTLLTGHDDAVIAAGAALLGVLSQIPVIVWTRGSTERHERDVWLRDRRVATTADVLA